MHYYKFAGKYRKGISKFVIWCSDLYLPTISQDLMRLFLEVFPNSSNLTLISEESVYSAIWLCFSLEEYQWQIVESTLNQKQSDACKNLETDSFLPAHSASKLSYKVPETQENPWKFGLSKFSTLGPHKLCKYFQAYFITSACLRSALCLRPYCTSKFL